MVGVWIWQGSCLSDAIWIVVYCVGRHSRFPQYCGGLEILWNDIAGLVVVMYGPPNE